MSKRDLALILILLALCIAAPYIVEWFAATMTHILGG